MQVHLHVFMHGLQPSFTSHLHLGVVMAQWIRHMPLVWETRVLSTLRHQCVPEQDTW